MRAFPAKLPPSSETVITIVVTGECPTGCSVCASLFPVDAGDDGTLFDPRRPDLGGRTTLAIPTTGKGQASSLLYRSPAREGFVVASFLLSESPAACGATDVSAPTGEATVRLEISGGSGTSKSGSEEIRASGDAGTGAAGDATTDSAGGAGADAAGDAGAGS